MHTYTMQAHHASTQTGAHIVETYAFEPKIRVIPRTHAHKTHRNVRVCSANVLNERVRDMLARRRLLVRTDALAAELEELKSSHSKKVDTADEQEPYGKLFCDKKDYRKAREVFFLGLETPRQEAA